MRVLDFDDGYSTSTSPTQGNLQANSLKQFATDGAFVADKGSAATDGDIYYNTNDDLVHVYENSAWHYLLDDTFASTISGVDSDQNILAVQIFAT